MPRFNKGPILRVLGGIAGIAFGFVSYQSVMTILTSDPLRDFRAKPEEGERAGIVLRDAQFKLYSGARMGAKGAINAIDVSRDRQIVWLDGLHDGVLYDKSGRQFKFWGKTARWYQYRRELEAEGQVRIVNADLDLTTSKMKYSDQSGVLAIPASISGGFYRGKIQAPWLRYHLPSGGAEIGSLTWVGELADPTQEKGKPTRWTIRTNGTTTASNDVLVYPKAEATDGEIIVRADRIEHNRRTDVIIATGNVRYYGKEANLLCAKATVYRKEKRAVLESDVSMLIKPKDQEKLEVVEIEPMRPIVPDSIAAERPPAPSTSGGDDDVHSDGNRRKYPVNVFAQRIEYWYAKGSRRAQISGSPQAKQDLGPGKWRRVWSTTAFYNGEQEWLRLDSAGGKTVRMKTSLGDDLKALSFQISTKENDDAWSANQLEGDVISTDDELNDRGGSSNPPTNEKPPALKGNIRG